MSKLKFAEISDPGTPASGYGYVFVQTDGIYFTGDNGTKKKLDVGDNSGIIPATKGGTGQSSYTTGDLLYASSGTALSKLAAGTDDLPLVSNGAGVAPSYQQLPTGGIAADAIDDTRAGDRVPQFYRRQGGSASDWSSPGTTSRTPNAVRLQSGVASVAASATNQKSIAITFPVAYSNTPLVTGMVRFATIGTNQDKAVLSIGSISSSGMNINIDTVSGNFSDTNLIVVAWSVVGPE